MSKIITKICKCCGKPFETDKNSQGLCSQECRIESIKTKQKEYHMRKRLSQTQICDYCGKEFHNGRRRQYCSNECRLAANGRGDIKQYEIKKIKPKLSIGEVNKLAREEGLTYGEYCAKYKIT